MDIFKKHKENYDFYSFAKELVKLNISKRKEIMLELFKGGKQSLYIPLSIVNYIEDLDFAIWILATFSDYDNYIPYLLPNHKINDIVDALIKLNGNVQLTKEHFKYISYIKYPHEFVLYMSSIMKEEDYPILIEKVNTVVIPHKNDKLSDFIIDTNKLNNLELDRELFMLFVKKEIIKINKDYFDRLGQRQSNLSHLESFYVK